MGEDEEATIRTLTAYREVMATLIQQHRGRVVDSPGDNLLAEFASAVDAVKRSVAHAPNWFSGYVVMGMILNSMGRPQETIRMREQVMRLDPQSVPYLIPLGDAYRMTGQYEEAISVLKRAIALALNNLGAHLYLAATYSEFDREEEARAEVAEVLRLSPQFSLEALGQMPYKDPAEGERVLAALRKAGLK